MLPNGQDIRLIITLTIITVQRLMRRKSTWVLLLLGMLPASSVLLLVLERVSDFSMPTTPYGFFRNIHSYFFLTFYVQLVSLFLGLGTISEEIDSKNITYLLVRPIPRYGIVIGRFLGFLIVACSLVAIGMVVTYGATMVFQIEAIAETFPLLLNSVMVMCIGVLGYLGVVALLGTHMKRFAVLVSVIWIVFDVGISQLLRVALGDFSIRYRMLMGYWEMPPEIFFSLGNVEPGSTFVQGLVVFLFAAIAVGFASLRLMKEVVLSEGQK